MRSARTETGIVTAIVGIAAVLAGRFFLPPTWWTVVLVFAAPLVTYIGLEWAVRRGKL